MLEPLEGRILLSTSDSSLAPGAPATAIHVPWSPAPPAGGGNLGALPAVQATISWNIDGDGDWNVASNWSGGVVPGPNDDVVIDRGAANPTITISSPVSVHSLDSHEHLVLDRSLTLATDSVISGALDLNDDLTFHGTLALGGNTQWNSGIIAGDAALANSGTFTKANNNLSLRADFNNSGTLNLAGGATEIFTGKTLTNQVGGTLNITGAFSNSGSGPLVNAGLLNVTGDDDPDTGFTPRIVSTLNNTGTIHVLAGTLDLVNAGTSSGILNVDTGATLAWTGGAPFLLDTGTQIQGEGRYQVTGFADVDVAAGLTVTFKHLQIDPFSSIGGAGNVDIPSDGVLDWEGGGFDGTGKTTIEHGGVANARDVSFGQNLEAHTMDLHGTINLTSTNLFLHNQSTLNIMSDGVVNLYGTASLGGPASSLNILGQLNGYATAGKSVVINSGTTTTVVGQVHASTGNLAIFGGLTSTGAFIADAGATISFDDRSNYMMNSGTTWTGAGSYYIDGVAAVIIPAGLDFTVPDLQLNGSLGGPGNVIVPSGVTLSFPSGATLFGTGTTTFAAGSTVTGTQLSIAGHTLTNFGSVSLASLQGFDGTIAVVNNKTGADFTITEPAVQTFGTPAGVDFENDGTLTLIASAGTGAFDGVLNNRGTLKVSGGKTTLSSSTAPNTFGTSSGIIQVDAGATLDFATTYSFTSGAQFTGAGLYQFNLNPVSTYTIGAGVTFNPAQALLNGTITGAGTVAIPSGGVWTGGIAPNLKNLGSFTIANGASFTVGSGVTFDNTPVTNSGVMAVGPALSEIALSNGAVLTNTASGEVHFTISASDFNSKGFTGTGAGTFLNQGLLRVTGSGTFSAGSANFSNPGTVEADGVTFYVAGFTLPQLSEDQHELTGGTWRVLNGATLTILSIDFGDPLSTVSVSDADVTLDGAGSTFNAVNNLNVNNGRLVLLNGASLDSNLFVNNGGGPAHSEPGPFTNTGTVELGAGSALRVGTDFTQSVTGHLIVHLAGAASFGQTSVTGTANLGGTLQVLLDGGFLPDPNSTYDLLTYGARHGNFASVSGVQPLFAPTVAATFYRLKAIGAAANLAPTALSGTGGGTGQNITLSYTVANSSTDATNANSWTDSFYLSPTATFDVTTATLLGRKVHPGPVAGSTSYSDSATFTIPAVLPGAYYLIAVTDSRGEVADRDRTNNTFVGALVNITTPTLTPGTPATGTLGNGETQLYKFTLPAGVTRVTVTTSAAGAAELLVRKGTTPMAGTSDAFAYSATATAQSVLLTQGAGDYYVELVGTSLAAAGATFSLLAQTLAFGLDDASPFAGTNNGPVTLKLTGAQFTANTAFSLVPTAGVTLTPTRVVIQDAATAFVTFDLTGAAPGAFDVKATDGANSATLTGGFTVLAAPVVDRGLEVSLTISGPAGFRIGGAATILITYRNAGSVDLPAPYLVVSTNDGSFRYPGEDAFIEDYVGFFALNQNGGDPGVLAPGATGTQFFSLLANATTPGATVTYSVAEVDPNAAVDYAEVKRVLQPPDFSDTQFAPVLAQLQAQLGPSYLQYTHKLAADAKLIVGDLHEAQQPIYLLALELEDALAATGTSLRGKATGPATPGSLVTAFNETTGDVFTTHSRADGSFVFGRVTAGSYDLEWDGALISAGGSVSVAAGQSRTGVALTLTAGSSLAGTISAQSGGAALAGAQVEITDAAGRTYQTVADAAGHYALTGLDAGPYGAVIEAEGKARGVFDNITAASVDFTLANESVLTGLLTPDPLGPGGDDLVVTARRQDDPVGFGFALNTTGDGFHLGGLAAGTYDVTIARDGYVTKTFSNVVVGSGATVDLGNTALVAANSISGNVSVDVQGLSSAGLSVTASLGGVPVAFAPTDANGLYTLTGLAPGSYVVDVSSTGTFHTPQTVVAADAETATGIDFTVQPGGTVTGTATINNTGTPLVGYVVNAVDAQGQTFAGYTDATGHYTITGLPLGSYRVTLRGASNLTTGQVNVTQLDQVPQTVNLQASVAAQLTGQLLLNDGTPASAGRVALLENGQTVATATADSTGHYEFMLNAVGVFDVVAVAESASFTPATGVDMTAGGSFVQNFTAGTGSVQVTVTDPADGTAGDLLSVYQNATGVLVTQITLDATGLANLANLAPGDYRLSVDGTGRLAEGTVTVAAGAATANLTEATASSLTGHVTTTGGGAITNGVVTLYPNAGGATYTAAVNPDGSYLFPTLPNGTYTAVAYSNGTMAQTQSNVVVNGPTTTDASLTSNSSEITGVVKAINGNPIVNADVFIFDDNQRVLGQGKTGVDGRFTIDSVFGPSLHLRVVPPDAPKLDFLDTLQLNEGDKKDVGEVQYLFLATGPFTNPFAGLKSPVDGTPQTIIDILNNNFPKFEFNVSPPANDCEMTCMSAYNTAKAKIAVADADYAKMKEFEKLDTVAALLTLFAFGRDVTPFFLLIGAAVGAVPVVGSAIEGYGLLTLLTGAGSTLAGMVSGFGELIDAKDPKDAQEVSLGIGSLSLQASDLFGKAISKVEGVGEATDGIFKKVAIAGALVDALNLLKSLSNRKAFDLTNTGFKILAMADQKYQASLKVYKQAVTDANGAIEDYNRCKLAATISGDSPNCQRPPPPDIQGFIQQGTGTLKKSYDPNDIVGPAGVGAAGFVAPHQALAYTIHFENTASASANAAVVKITQTLDPRLDLSTFRPVSFGFGGQTYDIGTTANPLDFFRELDLTADRGILLDVSAKLDPVTGVLNWTFTSKDPLTGDVTGDAALGFLPPNANGTEGQGFVSYSVEAKASAPTGSPIVGQASIVFDSNPAIATAPIMNTVDSDAPVSQVAALPAIVGPNFSLNWTGATDNGSGVGSYDLFVSDNGGAFTPIALGTPHTAQDFTGVIGHTYRFAVAAHDLAGNVEALPNVADVTVTVAAAAEALTFDAAHSRTFTDANGDLVTVKLTGPGSGTFTLANALLADGVANHADLRSLQLTGTTATSSLSITVKKAGAGTGTTNVGRIVSQTPLNALTLGPGVTLGDGLDDTTADLTLASTVKTLSFNDVAGYAQIEIGGGLTALQSATLKPTLTAGRVLGPDVAIDIHGGLGLTTLKSWNDFGFLTTEQSIAGLTVTAGDFNANVDIDSGSGFAGTATMGALSIKAGALRSTTFFVEGKFTSLTATGGVFSQIQATGIGTVTAGSFNGASLQIGAGGIGNVTATKGSMTNTTITSIGGKIGNLTVNLVGQTGIVGAMNGVHVNGTQIGNITASVTGLATLTSGAGITSLRFYCDGRQHRQHHRDRQNAELGCRHCGHRREYL